jgi:antitoxin MazE
LEYIMTMLTKIGNSQGIRIPKALIAQAHLENVPIELEVVENGLLIKPVLSSKRQNWKEHTQNVLLKNKDVKEISIIDEFLNDNDLEEHQ